MNAKSFLTAAVLAVAPAHASLAQQKPPEVCTTTQADILTAKNDNHSTGSVVDGRAEIILLGRRVLVTLSDAIERTNAVRSVLANPQAPSADCGVAQATMTALFDAGRVAYSAEAKAAQARLGAESAPAAKIRDDAINAAQDAYKRAVAPAQADVADLSRRFNDLRTNANVTAKLAK